ncbi:MAG TPA: 30S ribosomal protein S17 [Planctomycetaceae bacterium]|nr:30S ribosomal protein S17 [Planctomycetaceae bacterium]|tara:strand:- start:740 stop:1105 length:366 start_codon:yes stop_codon:yes gene_type:complete
MKRTLTGTVASDKASKTLRVEIERRFQHRKYGKIVRARTVCHVHDEEEQAAEGDVVEIVECPPRSKTKRWDLVRIVKKATDVSRAAEEAASAEDEPLEAPAEEASAEETTEDTAEASAEEE